MTSQPYKSFEERIFVDSGIKDSLVYGGKALYGTVISMFRLPTCARKVYNHQTYLYRDKNAEFGFLVGSPFGFVFDLGYFSYSITQ